MLDALEGDVDEIDVDGLIRDSDFLRPALSSAVVKVDACVAVVLVVVADTIRSGGLKSYRLRLISCKPKNAKQWGAL